MRENYPSHASEIPQEKCSISVHCVGSWESFYRVKDTASGVWASVEFNLGDRLQPFSRLGIRHLAWAHNVAMMVQRISVSVIF